MPRTAILQCHGIGSAKFGSATEMVVPYLAVPRTAVWQCHEFGSATDLAVPNLAVPWAAV